MIVTRERGGEITFSVPNAMIPPSIPASSPGRQSLHPSHSITLPYKHSRITKLLKQTKLPSSSSTSIDPMEKSPLLLSSLLFLALSLPIHARESQFFAKTTRLAATEEPAAALPTQIHVGHGLYGDADFTAAYDNYKERSTGGVNNVPSSFANADLAAGYDNYKERSNANDVPQFPAETYETKELSETRNIPSTFSDEEFRRYESARVADFSSHGERYGMSDTRFLENRKYFYDVNAERNGEGYEPARESSERYGSYGNKDDDIPEEFVP